jgi:hypothetical protein
MNVLLKPVIIQIHKENNGGGIADLLKGLFTLYNECKKRNIKYYLDLSQNKKLQKCFDLPKIPEYYKDFECETFNLLDQIYDYEKYKELILSKTTEPKIYYIITNCCGFGNKKEYINNINEINNIIKPSYEINRKINFLYNQYQLEENKYISIHFRTGDHHMFNQFHNQSDQSILDNRININNDIYKKIIDKIDYMNKEYNLYNLPLIIHSDSNILKNKLKKLNNNLILLDIDIQHVSSNIGNNNENSFISTISEFFILSKASKIFMMEVYSGFSHLSSTIGNKDLIVNIDDKHMYPKNILDILGPEKIVRIN